MLLLSTFRVSSNLTRKLGDTDPGFGMHWKFIAGFCACNNYMSPCVAVTICSTLANKLNLTHTDSILTSLYEKLTRCLTEILRIARYASKSTHS